MGAFSPVLNGMLGSIARSILNKIGYDMELAYRRVSAIAQVESEINYWKTGTIVYAVAEANYYQYNGATWVMVYLEPSVNHVHFNTLASPPAYQEGTIFWDADSHALSIYGEMANTSMQVGQEFWARVLNKTGATITDGKVVFISGAQGNRPTAELALASNFTADKTIGVVTTDILNNSHGNVTTMGVIHEYNTSSFAEGDILYLSATVPGGLQNTPPQAPNHAVRVAVALNSTANGSIYVAINIGSDLDTLHDVALTSPACGDGLLYTAVDGVWTNRQINPIVTKTTDYPATRLDNGGGTILVSCSTANITITLPSVSDAKTVGMKLTIKKIDSTGFSVIIDGAGSETIDGQLTKELLSQYQSIQIHANSTGWWVV